jgi:hypothetical protein
MKKYLLLLCSLITITFSSCDKTYSLQFIDITYQTPENGIIDAKGGEITVNVHSTHSFQLFSECSDVNFLRDGLVNLSQEGFAIIQTPHNIFIQPNKTGEERIIYISATHLNNPDIQATIPFRQPALNEKEDNGEDTQAENTEDSVNNK